LNFPRFGLLLAIVVLVPQAPGGPDAGPRRRAHPGKLPPLVFVSRQPVPGEPQAIPGFGPHHRDRAPGGRLRVRERDGSIHDLLPAGALFDVADPTVAWDGERVAFAGTVSPDSAWRIWLVRRDGTGLVPVTRSNRVIPAAGARFHRPEFARYDDLDPCWLPDGRIVFASTRFPQRAQQGDVLATNLFVVHPDGSGLQRITSERNGAEEPSVDPLHGRIVYGRWLFSRYLPSDLEPHGITLDRARAVPQDTIDIWQAVSVAPDGDGIRLAGGDARSHARMVAYAPRVLSDSTLIAVYGTPASLSPTPVEVGILAYPRAFARPRRLTGAGTAFPGAACAPAVLPDERLVFAGVEEGHTDLGLFVMRSDGSNVAAVLDEPGLHELDPAILASRPAPPILVGQCEVPAPELPLTHAFELADSSYTFRFDCGNVFATGPLNSTFPDAPPLGRGLRIRFFGVVARPEAAGGDSLVLVREMPVDPSGAIHVDDIRADTPLFEQLVDAQGRVIRSARGPAHVPGFNFARLGAGTKCVGCHAGHSALPVPINNWRAKWFNASPSAVVTVSSLAAGSAQALVDRQTRGPIEDVGWVSEAAAGASVRLSWNTPIEVRGLVLYSVSAVSSEVASHATPRLQVHETEIVFLHAGREVKRLSVRRILSPQGTRVDCEPVRVDAIEIYPTRVSGRFRNRSAAALAEIETFARLVED